MSKKKTEIENGLVATELKVDPMAWTDEKVIEFVRTWQRAGSIEDVSKAMGRSIQSCYTKAREIKKQGIPMKKLGSGGNVNWDAVKAALGVAKPVEMGLVPADANGTQELKVGA